MSTSLVWFPPGNSTPLPYELKKALEGTRYDNDCEISSCDREFFAKLAKKKIKGAKEVLAAIDKYDQINLGYRC